MSDITRLAALFGAGMFLALPLNGNGQTNTYQFIPTFALGSDDESASGVIYTTDPDFWTDGGTPTSGSYFHVADANVTVDLSLTNGLYGSLYDGVDVLAGNTELGVGNEFSMSGAIIPTLAPPFQPGQSWTYSPFQSGLTYNGYGYWQYVGNYAPSINSQPTNLIVSALTVAQFSVKGFGTPPLAFQWQLNGTNILGATNGIFTISSVRQSDLGIYSVVVTNEFGAVTSSNALLSMYPFIETPFSGAITYWGKDATLSVGAWGTGPLNYQWYDNGVVILNATNGTLNLTSIQFTNAGFYSVVVSSALGTATNTPAQVVVNAAQVSLGFSPTLTINGAAGYSYIIQRSTDLTNTNNWMTLTNITLTQPVEVWVDTSVDASSPLNNKLFYSVAPQQ